MYLSVSFLCLSAGISGESRFIIDPLSVFRHKSLVSLCLCITHSHGPAALIYTLSSVSKSHSHLQACYLTVFSALQTVDMCSECNQIVRLSTNMISSRDTKVRMLLNHPPYVFFFFSFTFTSPSADHMSWLPHPTDVILPVNVLISTLKWPFTMLQLPSVCLCRKTHF